MTPDWAAKPTNVPYASFGNPQSLNLYGYVENNPTTVGDLDGHDGGGPDASWQTDPKAKANGVPAQNAAAATVAAPTTLEEIDAVVKPLVDSAISAGEKAGSALVDAGETALGAVAFVVTAGVGKTGDNAHDTLHPETTDTAEPEPAAAAGGSGQGVRGGKKDRSQQGVDDQLTDIKQNQVNLRKVGQGEKIRSTKKSEQAQDHKNSRITSAEDIENQ